MKNNANKYNVQLTDSVTHPKSPTDFFEDKYSWLTEPDRAFASWIAGQKLADSSKKVRQSMWNKFSRWLDSNGIGVQECKANHIMKFIQHSKLEKEQAWRYVRLIEKVYDRLVGLGMDISNPGRKAAKQGVGNGSNDEKRFLTPDERQKLDSFLKTFFACIDSEEARRNFLELEEAAREKCWAGIRDVIIVAVVYGAGVGLTELAALSVNCTYKNGVFFLPLTKRGKVIIPERSPPLIPVAVDTLRIWGFYRNTYKNVGLLLFPAMVNRRRQDQQVKTAVMHPSTIFRRLRGVLHRAGITSARASGQTLRNTYAAYLIESGKSNADLKEALGYYDDFSAKHLREAHEEWVKRLSPLIK